MKRVASKQLTDHRRAELFALDALPDDRIDTGDIPEIVSCPDAGRGLFYRPGK